MGSKKRNFSSDKEVESEKEASMDEKRISRMEKLKKRKELDKQRHQRTETEITKQHKAVKSADADGPTDSGRPGFHIDVFRDLASPETSVREAAVEKLALELYEVQMAYEQLGNKESEDGAVQLEAEKDDGLENCAPSLRYAVRRLIRGVSSSRECARQGFALGLTIVVGKFPVIKVESLMKLIVDLLEISSSMKGQEARDCLLGRLFAYGSLARSGRIAAEWNADNTTSAVKDFVTHVVTLAGKKRYLREPAVSIILVLVEMLPLEAVFSHVLQAPGMHDWFQKAAEVGDPDALFLALKLQERVPLETDLFGKLLPNPFSPDNFFARDHLLYLAACFKDSTFCLPRVHSLWPLLVNTLLPELGPYKEDASPFATSSKKHKKNRKNRSSEEITKNLRCFCEVVIEESLLSSSHDRKHLALNILLLLLPRLPASCIEILLSHKLVQCLMDILSTKGSWLYGAAQHFVKELTDWVGDDDDRRVQVIVYLQKHSNGRFDSITRAQTVKELVSKFHTGPGCLLFVHNLMSLFVDGSLSDEPSDQSQTTDENSETGSPEDSDSLGLSGNSDVLKNWVIDTMPRILKNLKLDPNAKTLPNSEYMKFIEAKFRVQTEIMKFLVVQGLFSASLGTEVTSFELQEKFKWPKAATSNSLCRMCIEQLQLLLEDAQKGEGLYAVTHGLDLSDLGSYFACFLNTLCNIPSVALYRSLDKEDDNAFKKLLAVVSRLSQEERSTGPGLDLDKSHAIRYLLIQLLLQVLLHPEEFAEAALELVICCKKAFPGAARGDSTEEEDEFDDNDAPELMDVVVDTLLSLLPHSSGPMCYAIEQVFRFFCDDITDDGILRMLRVVKKDLKRARRQAVSDEDEEEDDFLGVEDAEDMEETEIVETGEGDGLDNDSDGMPGEAVNEESEENDEADSGRMNGVDPANEEAGENVEDLSASDDESDGGMDDDAMFRMDSYLARIFKERKLAGNDGALSQLIPFKLRVLSLLEIYLQKNPGKPQVLTVYSYLAQAFFNANNAEGNEQLAQRIGGILQKKIFKAKDYPKGNEIQLATLETLLEKSVKSASRSRHQLVSSLTQTATFWLLKIIQSKNFSTSELERVVSIFQQTLLDYFNNKKCRLKSEFLKEVIQRYPWLGLQIFGFLMEKCGGAKSEYRRTEALELIDCIMKSSISSKKGDEAKDISNKTKLLKQHLPAICELIRALLSKLPEKKSRRAEVRKFCGRVLHAILTYNLRKPFLKNLKPDAYALCETHLVDGFLPFKATQ